MANPAKTAAEIREEEERLLVERFELLYDKIARSGAMGYGSDEFKDGLRWRLHPDLYAKIMTSEYLYRVLLGYQDLMARPGAPTIMGIPIDRDSRMPKTEIILRWEAKSDG